MVWSNFSKEQLDKLLRLQKRCARMILNPNFQDNLLMLFTKLGWLPFDDIIHTRKLSFLHKICNGCGPEYLSSYVNCVKSIAMITAQEPQEDMILSCLSARKIQASEHSIPVPLVCGTKLNHLLET